MINSSIYLSLLLLLFISVTFATNNAREEFPYPSSSNPPGEIIVYSDMYLNAGDNLLITLLTLGGGLARTQPKLYRIPKDYPSKDGSDSYSAWLTIMKNNCPNEININLSMIQKPYDILSLFHNKITGYVLYNTTDGSVNAALTYIAGQKQNELLVATSSTSTKTLSMLKSWSIPFVIDLSGTRERDAYKSRGGISAYSGNMISFQHPNIYPNLAEYAIFGRMPTLEYSTDTTKYPNGGEQVQEAIAEFSKTKDLKAAMGWGPEYQYVSKLGEKGFFVHASDMAHNVAVLSNYKCGEMKKHLNNSVVKERKKMKKGVTDNNKHRIAFLMTDGDNIQWLMNSFVTNQNWWGSKSRGKVPLGWTISPGLVELGLPIIEYLKKTSTANDDFIGAPSGLGYVYPATWKKDQFNEFANLTGYYLNKTRHNLIIGDGDDAAGSNNNNNNGGVVNVIGAGNLNSPNMSVLQPLLEQETIEGIFWYTFGAGYSGWTGTKFDPNTKKPVIGGRVSLWGNSTSGTMQGVIGTIQHFKNLLKNKEISRDMKDVNGYSLVPVNVWSHTVDDVVTVANELMKTGNFEIITPSALLKEVKNNCFFARQFRSCNLTTCCCPGDPTGEACCGPGRDCAGTGLGSCGCLPAGPAPCVADSGARLGDRRKCGSGVVTDLASVCSRTNPVCDCAVHSPCGAPAGTGSCLSSHEYIKNIIYA